MTITWAELDAECEGFREGFVACFRRHEGEETDRRDPRHKNKFVRVTITSFAAHFGIPYATFHNWVVPPPPRKSRAKSRSTVPSDTDVTVDQETEIIQDDDLFGAEVKRRRAEGGTIKGIAKEMRASRRDVQRFAGRSLTHPENSISCGLETPSKKIKEVDELCTWILGKVYTLGSEDLKRFKNILGLHIAEIDRQLEVAVG